MADTFPPLTTERLLLRRFTDGDLDALLAYRNDPEVARYQSWESCSEEDGRHLIAVVKTLRPGIPGCWLQVAVELQETRELIGDVAFSVNAEDPAWAEVGFTFARASQGRGYATEAMACLLHYLFETLGICHIAAITDSLNRPAAALLQRLGFRYHETQEVTFKGRPGGEDRYTLPREEWERSLAGKLESA
jgi:RimJ/RimL family protein N-acetyltransferase